MKLANDLQEILAFSTKYKLTDDLTRKLIVDLCNTQEQMGIPAKPSLTIEDIFGDVTEPGTPLLKSQFVETDGRGNTLEYVNISQAAKDAKVSIRSAYHLMRMHGYLETTVARVNGSDLYMHRPTSKYKRPFKLRGTLINHNDNEYGSQVLWHVTLPALLSRLPDERLESHIDKWFARRIPGRG